MPFPSLAKGEPQVEHSEFESRLSRISTRWTLLREAHGDADDERGLAMAALLERYRRAVYGYLVVTLRSHDAAEEVFQDFAVRFLEGGFGRADPGRGRFRNYLKTAIVEELIPAGAGSATI
jgi:RNA polymerase sigma-70 factor (ECF subfamily)